jgi:hypothetical protein
MAAMLTFANLIAAFFLARRDAFTGKFLLSTSLLVHLLAWIALIQILW